MSERRHSLIDGYDPRTKEYKLIKWLLVFYVVWKTMPIVALYMNTYVAMLLLVIAVFAMLLSAHSFNVHKVALLSTVLLTFMGFMELGAEGKTFLNSVWSSFLMIFPIFMGCMLVVNKMDRVIRTIVPLIYICSIISAFTTYLGLAIFPEASRILATTTDEYLIYYKYNLGGFNIIYMLVAIHPIVVGMLRTRNKKTLSIVYTVVCGLCVFRSAYALAAMFYLASCVVYIFPVSGDISRAKKWVKIVVIGLIVAMFFAPAILDSLAEWDLLEDSADKMRDVARILRGGQGVVQDTEARQDTYSESLETFLKYPLTGTIFLDADGIGEHSFVFDAMGYWGIWGLIVVVAFYFSLLRMYKRFTGKSPIYYCAILSLIISIALSVLNSKTWPYELGFATPLCIRYCSMKHESNELL